MAFIIETVDPFNPLKGMQKHEHPGYITIRAWLQEQYPGFLEFDKPTICLVNGAPVLREDWDKREILPNDIVNFVAVVGYEWVAIIAVVLVIALAVYMAVTTKTPETPGELPSSSPVFSTQGKTNTIRLGEPIECNYGRNRIYPSLASRPFFRYVGNDQFQHTLLCIGQGEYSIADIFIGDTPIANFEEVEYEILEPGDVTTLFATNVVTSVEVGGQTLYAPNQPEYVAPGWVGPFPTNPSGTESAHLEIDLTLPRGLYQTDRRGRLLPRTVTVEVMYRRINDVGAPLTAYASFLDDSTITKRTTTPQRLTFERDVTPGRYEIRARRISNKIGQSFGMDQINWEGMRGFITGDEPDYGDVTMLAVKIRATNNLNSRTQEKFNVVATRKLPIRESDGSWSAPAATRSIIWAYVDAFKADYGGRVADMFFDWDTLEELDALYAAREEYFDWTFRDPITVWDAAKTIARVGRAVPLLSGSLITMRRDGPLSVPVTLFTPDNIVKGSFQYDVKLWEPNDSDSIAVEYTEVETGYKQEVVICTLPGGTTDRPEDVRIAGVQDRSHAYREGLFLYASRLYLRENISFETGMEGFIPSYGDLVSVAHDVPRWAQHGYILAVEEVIGGFLLAVTEPLEFSESGGYQILLRAKNGDLLGPYDTEEQSDPKTVLILVPDSEIDFLLGGRSEPMLFLFGIIDIQVKQGRVVKLEPQGGERVKITLINNAPIIHTFDDLEPPPLTQPTFPDDPDLPSIAVLDLAQVPLETSVAASWTAATGALSYIVEISYDDGDSWERVGTPVHPFMVIDVLPGEITVRVAAVAAGQGPWIENTIVVSPIMGMNIYDPWEALTWTVFWWDDTDIDKFVVSVYNIADPDNPILARTESPQDIPQYTYNYAKALVDGNLSRFHRLSVDAMVTDEETGDLVAYNLPATIDLENSIPEPPLHPNYELDEIGSGFDVFDYRFFWDNPAEGDTITAKLWVSLTPGFDPALVDPVRHSTAGTPGYTNVAEELFWGYELVDNIHPNLYWRVGLFDVWGNEISTNVSDEQTIAPVWLLAGGDWTDEGRWRDDEFWED